MTVNSGDTAWLLVSTALVMLMTPGVALFYGGMVRRKNASAFVATETEAIIRPEKLDPVKLALEEKGITGLTVTEVR